MSSSTCESEGQDPQQGAGEPSHSRDTPGSPTGRQLRGLRTRRKPASDRLLLWVPTLLLLLATVAILIPWNRKTDPGGLPPIADRWFQVGRGDTEFLGDRVGFLVLRRATRDDLYRVEIPDQVAFESPRLDEVFQLFLQHRLGGLQTGESLAFRFWPDRGTGVPTSHIPSAPLAWDVVIAEELRDNESWFRAPHGRTGEALYARSLEALKTRLGREISRDVKAVLSGELIPR